MAMNVRLLGRGILCCHGLRTLSVSQCRTVSIQPRPAVPPCQEGHDERNMRLCRPQSPHLTIYKFQLTSMLSITHRFTGIALSGYAALFAGTSLLSSQPMGEIINNMAVCYPTMYFLFKLGLVFPFTYHFFNGIRHLIWDTGSCLTMGGVYVTGYVMLACTVLSTIGILYFSMGPEEDKEIQKCED